MSQSTISSARNRLSRSVLGVLIVSAAAAAVWYFTRNSSNTVPPPPEPQSQPVYYRARRDLDTSGFYSVMPSVAPWKANASLKEISEIWRDAGYKAVRGIDEKLADPALPADKKVQLLISKAVCLNFEGAPAKAYDLLTKARKEIEAEEALAVQHLYTLVYLQGVTALRRGETENCIECRGEGSCILPIAPSAVHQITDGSRLAVKHFTEYLERFPNDFEVRWLLNLAYMTLGEHPDKVPAEQRMLLGRYRKSEFDIGRFRDVGHRVGVNRFNQSGGGIMEDFDNDGLLDVFVTALDPTMHAGFFRNLGNGRFEDQSIKAGLAEQLGGLYCVQTDYNNDGFADVFICRGAWLQRPIRPSLLRNNGDCTFTDVTEEAGLLHPVNSITASWADYDNDGWLDLYVCCERSADRLYRNQGNGKFEDVSVQAGLAGNAKNCKGSAWIDYDNDDAPDLFLNNFDGSGRLFHNNGDGTFAEVTATLGIDGPLGGFSCWAWDYNNDGWLDLFATCYDFTLAGVVKGIEGRPHKAGTNRLFRNVNGKRFEDVTIDAGLGMVFATMGSNFGDFDNDGFLDAYLGTGAPGIDFLVPNRMFKNVAGERFSEITYLSGTGHLQKGHGVACGDWDRNGDVDVFIQMGGAINGDKFHNVLFQNPGQGNHWLTLKLIGRKTNRAALGARIKVVTEGEKPLTVYRHVTTGSSFGANPFQQTIGIAKAQRIATLEIHWPTSKTTQRFHDLDVDQAIEVTELADDYRKLEWKPIPLPKEDAQFEPPSK